MAAKLNTIRAGGSAVLPGADPGLLLKLIRIASGSRCERRGAPVPDAPVDQPTLAAPEIDMFADVYDGLAPPDARSAGTVWSISRNRQASTSIWRSRMTVKADAAARLFDMRTIRNPVGCSRYRYRCPASGVQAARPGPESARGGPGRAV